MMKTGGVQAALFVALALAGFTMTHASGFAIVRANIEMGRASYVTSVLGATEDKEMEAALAFASSLKNAINNSTIASAELKMDTSSSTALDARVVLLITGVENDIDAKTEVQAFLNATTLNASSVSQDLENVGFKADDGGPALVSKITNVTVAVPPSGANSGGVATVYGTIIFGSPQYRTEIVSNNTNSTLQNLLDTFVNQEGPDSDVVSSTIEDAANSNTTVSVQLVVRVLIAETNHEAAQIIRGFLSQAPLFSANVLNDIITEYAGPTQKGAPAYVTNFTLDGVTSSAKADSTGGEAETATVIAKLATSAFTQADYTGHLKAYLDFRLAFLTSLESKVKTKCGVCQPLADINNITFDENSSASRKLLLNDITVDASVYNANNKDTEAAMDACSSDATCELGGAQVLQVSTSGFGISNGAAAMVSSLGWKACLAFAGLSLGLLAM